MEMNFEKKIKNLTAFISKRIYKIAAKFCNLQMWTKQKTNRDVYNQIKADWWLQNVNFQRSSDSFLMFFIIYCNVKQGDKLISVCLYVDLRTTVRSDNWADSFRSVVSEGLLSNWYRLTPWDFRNPQTFWVLH